MFDLRVLSSKHFDIPVIGVGNLSTGGTGKTPHVEFLIELLKNQYQIAVLSRGYKRKTRGFHLVTANQPASETGDEPLQICRKFPEVLVAVDEKRTRGIAQIRQLFPHINLIILDDAFQHRYVTPSLNVLITGFYDPFFDDFVLPSGNLREFKSGAKRADVLIVSKTPSIFPVLARKYFIDKVEKYNIKKVFFSTLQYGAWVPVNTGFAPEPSYKSIFLLTGIANPSILEEYLRRYCKELIRKTYPDHHQFTESDLLDLVKDFGSRSGGPKAVVMTEKDYMRIKEGSLLEIISKIPVFYIPVKVVLHKPDTVQFVEFLSGFLTENYPDIPNQTSSQGPALEIQNSR
jgi:tetraacyldisaccharide 4'-kinase